MHLNLLYKLNSSRLQLFNLVKTELGLRVLFALSFFIVGELLGHVLGVGSFGAMSPIFALGGGDGGGGGSGGESGPGGGAGSGSGGASGGGGSTGGSGNGGPGSTSGGGGSPGGGTASTPFLKVWDGDKFVHENDFLFGKPQTIFSTYTEGLAAYTSGIGGDTYQLSTALKADSEGNIQVQIKELEPEESFIDSFSLSAIDLLPGQHFVVDGNLNNAYVFEDQEVMVLEGQKTGLVRSGKTTIQATSFGYQSLQSPAKVKELTLKTGDELIIQIPREQLSVKQDSFILVDSHYRDWSLGDQVPFSRLEQLSIGSLALGRTVVVSTFGVMVMAAAMTGVVQTREGSFIQKLLGTPYTYADVPPGSCVNPPCTPTPGRSLVISAQDGVRSTYLQTLFPRYVQGSQEVVKIPKEVIKNLSEKFLTIKIKATRKHKVKAAFVFTGQAKAVDLKPLVIKRAIHKRTGVDHATDLQVKNNHFVHTIPGDQIDLTLKNVDMLTGTERRYVLKAHGFYTGLSSSTKEKIGDSWYRQLPQSDRSLLKRLRLC